MTNTITAATVVDLISSLPPGGVPTAWWATNHPDRLAEYEQYRVSRNQWRDDFMVLAAAAGGRTDRHAAYDKGRELAGIEPIAPAAAPPAGWHIDPWTKHLVPNRSPGNESPAASEFDRLARIPTPISFITGIGDEILTYGPDGDRVFTTDVRLLDGVLVAFQGGDPDNLEAGETFTVDPTWQRLPLSAFHLIREKDTVHA